MHQPTQPQGCIGISCGCLTIPAGLLCILAALSILAVIIF